MAMRPSSAGSPCSSGAIRELAKAGAATRADRDRAHRAVSADADPDPVRAAGLAGAGRRARRARRRAAGIEIGRRRCTRARAEWRLIRGMNKSFEGPVDALINWRFSMRITRAARAALARADAEPRDDRRDRRRPVRVAAREPRRLLARRDRRRAARAQLDPRLVRRRARAPALPVLEARPVARQPVRRHRRQRVPDRGRPRARRRVGDDRARRSGAAACWSRSSRTSRCIAEQAPATCSRFAGGSRPTRRPPTTSTIRKRSRPGCARSARRDTFVFVWMIACLVGISVLGRRATARVIAAVNVALLVLHFTVYRRR